MKKNVRFLAVFALVATLFCGCDPFEEYKGDIFSFMLFNNETNSILYVEYDPMDENGTQEYQIAVDAVEKSGPYFGYYKGEKDADQAPWSWVAEKMENVKIYRIEKNDTIYLDHKWYDEVGDFALHRAYDFDQLIVSYILRVDESMMSE